MSKILEALKQLDKDNDNHWTADGSPRLDTVKLLAADQSLTRDIVTLEAPGFSRSNNTLATEPTSETVVTAPTNDNETVPELEEFEEVEGEDEETTLARKKHHDAKTNHETLLHQAAKLKLEITKASLLADEAYDDMLVVVGVETTMDAIQGYHASQRKVLEDRAERMKALRKSGYSLKDFIPGKAPIDSALARKNGRGTTRPQR